MTIKWLIKYGNKILGPFDTARLRILIEKGKISPDTLIARDGTDDFRKIFLYSEFRDFVSLKINKKIFGPYSIHTVQKLVKMGKVTDTAMLSLAANPGKWHRITAVKKFADFYDTPAKGPKRIRCPKCDAPNPADAPACGLCNQPLQKKTANPCVSHPDKPAASKCSTCGTALCSECAVKVKDKVYCRKCREIERDRQKEQLFYKLGFIEKMRMFLLKPGDFIDRMPKNLDISNPIQFQQHMGMVFSVYGLLLILIVMKQPLFALVFGGFCYVIVKFILPAFIVKISPIVYKVISFLGGRGEYGNTIGFLCYYSGTMMIPVIILQILMVVPFFSGLMGNMASPVPMFVFFGILMLLFLLVYIWALFVLYLGLLRIMGCSKLVARLIAFGPFVLSILGGAANVIIYADHFKQILKMWNPETEETTVTFEFEVDLNEGSGGEYGGTFTDEMYIEYLKRHAALSREFSEQGEERSYIEQELNDLREEYPDIGAYENSVGPGKLMMLSMQALKPEE